MSVTHKKSRNAAISAKVKQGHATHFQKQITAVVNDCYSNLEQQVCLRNVSGLKQHHNYCTQRLMLLRTVTAQLTAAFKENEKQKRVLEWVIKCHCMCSCFKIKTKNTLSSLHAQCELLCNSDQINTCDLSWNHLWLILNTAGAEISSTTGLLILKSNYKSEYATTLLTPIWELTSPDQRMPPWSRCRAAFCPCAWPLSLYCKHDAACHTGGPVSVQKVKINNN